MPYGTGLGLLLRGGLLTVGNGLVEGLVVVASTKVGMVVPRGGGAAPFVIALSLVDARGLNP